jgi:ribonuclease P protein component
MSLSEHSRAGWNRQMRLRRPQDFRRVRSEGRSWAHPFFVIWSAPNALDYTRVGISASRRVGNAVQRNRARRLLRESMRQLYTSVAAGWDIVLIARSQLVTQKAPQVEAALRVVLERARLASFAGPECDAGARA